MPSTASQLAQLLGRLGVRARHRAWSDAEWARQAGIPKETLCRLRSRSTCDLATLQALAGAVGATLGVLDPARQATADGLWPARVDRALERTLLDLATGQSTRVEDWRPAGPPFFLAGVAVTLASATGFDRPAYLALAEALHPGATEPRVFSRWLAGTPLPPARFLPMVAATLQHAA
jgi:AraC-like DNA-binding protein